MIFQTSCIQSNRGIEIGKKNQEAGMSEQNFFQWFCHRRETLFQIHCNQEIQKN